MASSIATVKVFQKNLLATVGALSLAASTALLAQPVQAQAAVAKNIDIPAQSLASSLNQIGRQTSSEIIFLSSTVQGRRAPAVHGNFTAEQAIRLAIEGTALAARQTPQGAYVIERAPSSGEAGAGSAAAESGDAEIVVTARKREERLQDVPISIVALPQSALDKAGVKSVADLGTLVSGFTMGGFVTFAQPAIRGVSTTSSQGGSENPNAFYLDGVYQVSQRMLLSEQPDIDHIEVLKGPQGTLFGRNSTGGAIQIFTRDPVFTPTLDTNIEVGAYPGAGSSRSAARIDARAFVSLPVVSDVLAVSFSGAASYTKGYYTEDRTGGSAGSDSNKLIRGKILFTPGSALRIVASVYYTYSHSNAANTEELVNGLSAVSGVPGVIFAT